MIEAPERRGFSSVKGAIKLRRFIKELSHEEGINLGGRKGQRLDGILDRSDQVLSELEIEHADWISQKRQLFADYLSSVQPQAVEETYRAGLATTITQEFRTYGRVSQEEVSKLYDPEYLKGVITGHTVDFLRSLRLAQRMSINPNTALDVARLSYHYNPTRLIQLIRKYPDINLSAVATAALGYPKNPEVFLNGFIANVARLKPLYPDLHPSAITIAALNWPNKPEVYLDKIKRGEIVPTIDAETILPIEEELQEVPEEITLTDGPIGANGDVYNGSTKTENTTT